jgi:hypothetical protein
VDRRCECAMGLTPTEKALIGRACVVFGVASADHVDSGTNLYSWDGFATRATIDSLAVVEFLMAAGEELDVPLLEILDEGEIDTLGQLARLIEERAAPSSLDCFRERWAPLS